MSRDVRVILIIAGIILGVLIILPLVLGAVSGWPYGRWGMMWPGMMAGSPWMWLMPVLLIVFVGLIVWAIVALVRGSNGSKGQESSRTGSALEVLKQRYARGEISKEEYEEKKRDLT